MNEKLEIFIKTRTERKNFTKEFLKNNMVVELRNGVMYTVRETVLGTVLHSNNKEIPLHLEDYEDDLTYIYKGYAIPRWIPDKEKDIMVIYEPIDNLDESEIKCEEVWERNPILNKIKEKFKQRNNKEGAL